MTSGKAVVRALAAALAISVGAAAQTVLPSTRPLESSQDLAAEMVEGIHRFLDKATRSAASDRDRKWSPDFSSADAYWRSVEANRKRLATILGVVDARLPLDAFELVTTTDRPARIAVGQGYEVLAVRWQALPGVFGEGLLLQPGSPPRARIVAIPDASW